MNNQSDNLHGGVPLFASGWGAGNIQFNDSGAFWDDALRVTSDGQLGDHVDAAMIGRSSPRVWLFLHEPGEGHLGCASALGFARELAQRDQAVLLLDGDDDQAHMSHWAGRRDSDGWIDLIRYGSSVLTCGIPMPFEGRRGYFLGVGSFTPADVTAGEVKDLLVRLKRQADDILVVAPADTVGRLWAAEADLRLLCWDRAQRSATLMDEVAENFSAAGIALTGMIGFGLPQSNSVEVLDDPVETTEAPEAPGAAASVFDELENEDEGQSPEDEEFARRKGNSSVFWMAAVFSLVLIGGASVYFFKYLNVPAEGHFPASSQQELAMGGAAFFDSGTAALQDEIVNDGDGDLESADSSVDPVDDSAEDQASLDAGSEQSVDNSEKQPEIPVAVSEVNEDRSEPAVETPAVQEKVTPMVPPAPDGFVMDPYVLPVGGEGWTLHVYSFPDSLAAEKEKAVLAARGFHSATRTVQIKDKGRWFRLYLGSFKTKADANIARKKLMAELGEDWANPVRFSD